MNDSSLKTAVILQVENVLNKRLATLTSQVQELQDALQSDTKSSAGDKHETGRAMTQLELEKLSQQLLDVSNQFETFQRIRHNPATQTLQLGSLILTSEGWYYLSIPLGKIELDQEEIVFCLSPISPLGKLFLGRSNMDIIQFNGRDIRIEEIH